MSLQIKGLTVVIPALNENYTIGNVVREARKVAEHVLVVDDGSTDGTGDTAKAAGAAVLRHERPNGYDGAISDGLNAAFRSGAIAVATIDADGQHRIEDLRRIATPVLGEGVLFCGGVRDRYNRPVEKFLGLIAGPLYGTKDPFCGLKCYHQHLFQRCGPFPAAMHIGTLPLVWVRKGRLTHCFLLIKTNCRQDDARFGPLVQSSLKLVRAFLKTLFTDFLS